jgi:hypothetical protein
MSEQSPPKSKNTFSNDTPDTATQLKKIQHQLDALERKIDSLLKQSGPRHFKNPYPSKPRRDYDDTKRPFKQKHAKRKEAVRTEGKFYYGLQSGAQKSSGKSGFGRNKDPLKK